MAGIPPRKPSARGNAPSAQSQRSEKPAAKPSARSAAPSQRSAPQRPGSSRMRPPEPEPVIIEEEELLIEEAGEPLVMEEAPPPPKAKGHDPKAFSNDALYSDEDPLETLRKGNKRPAAKQRPSGTQPKIEVPRPSSRGSGIQPKVDKKDSGIQGKTERPSARGSGIQAKVDAKTSSRTSGIRESVKPGGSNRQAAIKPSGRRAPIEPEDIEMDEEVASPRASARMSKRGTAVQSSGGGISLKTKILGGLSVVAILVVVFGYKPFMKMQHLKKLDDPASSADAKQSAAKALFSDFNAVAFQIFAERLESSDAGIRDAAASGMEEFGKQPKTRGMALERFAAALGKGDAEAKITYIGALDGIAKSIGDPKTEGDALKTISGILVKHAEAGDLPVRKAALSGLKEMRVPGVCRLMVKTALAEKNELRTIALSAISFTALPDAAGDLLKQMSGTDKDLAGVCKKAFVNIRDQAPSADLVGLVNDPADDVRREIVEALGKRKNDTTAAQGIARAFKDKLPEIRTLAVKAVPTTTLSGPMTQLAELLRDPEESVRVATAETLGVLRDPDSYKVLLESFKNNPDGKTMEACIRSLGKRSNSGKDMNAIGIVMPLFDSNPGAVAALKEAMVLLTLAGSGPKREQERRAWDTAKWKSWYANIKAREALRKTTIEKLEVLRKRKDEDRSKYPDFYKQTVALLDELEKCKGMCQPDDPEDSGTFNADQKKYTTLQEMFLKGAAIDMRK